jgi:hypothetical protein
MTVVNRTEELKHRVLAKKAELQKQLELIKAEAHGSKTDEVERIEKKLTDLNDSLKEGWDNLSEQAVKRLNDWLKS